MHWFPKCVWNDTEIVWGHGRSPQTHDSCVKRQCGFGLRPTVQAAWIFFLAECPGTPPHPPYLFKMTSLIWCFWLQVPECCLGRLSTQPKPRLPAWAQRSGVLLSPGLPLLDRRRCVSSAHAPSSSLSISCAFSPSNKPFGWNRFYARSKKKTLLQEWAKVSVKEPRVWTCLLYWLQRLDIKCGSCSYMLTERFKAGKRWAEA